MTLFFAFLLFALLVLAKSQDCPALSAFHRPFVASHEKRTSDQLHGRQQLVCITQCDTISGVLECSDAACVCPILNAASPSIVSTCQNCLIANGYSYANLIPLAVLVCSSCPGQCGSILTGVIQTQQCTTLECECEVLSSGGASVFESCANCLESYNPGDSSDVVQIGQQCGVLSSSSPAIINSTVLQSSTTPTIAGSHTTATSIANSRGQAHIFKPFLNLYGMIMFLGIVFAVVCG